MVLIHLESVMQETLEKAAPPWCSPAVQSQERLSYHQLKRATFTTLLQSFPCILMGTNFPGKQWDHINGNAQKMSDDELWEH